MIRVLLVDDERNFIDGMALLLRDYGCDCAVAYDGSEALKAVKAEKFDVIVTDLIMPKMDGIAFLTQAHRIYPDLPSIVMTAHGGERENRTVRQLGAKNFVLKPVDVDQLANMIENLSESSRLQKERDMLKERLERHEAKSALSRLIGKSKQAQRLVDTIMTVAPTSLSVLITGESGTGKQVVAQSIHEESTRRAAAFVDANCASFSPTLLEDELFGHEKGAYTGAVGRRRGIFEKANGGTLFLDEIGEMPLPMQAKLLKVIEEKKFVALGGEREQESDFRLICATNRNLENEIAKGNFREDLYYRINKMTILVPPLRERESDIVLLSDRFMRAFAIQHGKPIKSISAQARDALCAYQWPGNIRELENVIETSVVMAKTEEIRLEDLPAKIISFVSANNRSRFSPEPADDAQGVGGRSDCDESHISIKVGSLEDMELQIIRKVLQTSSNNKTKAAKTLGISRKTLARRLGAGEEWQKKG